MKAERFVIVSDTHGDQLCPDASKAFFEFLKFWKPTVRIHLGDAFDFRALRRGANDEERRESLTSDIEAGCDFLRKLRPTHWLQGNHDARLYDLIAGDDRKLAGLAQHIVADIEDAVGDAKVLPYDVGEDGTMTYADKLLLHGTRTGLTATRNTALDYGQAVIHGHNHTLDIAITGGRSEPRQSFCSGCLLVRKQRYNRGMPARLRHEPGWLYGMEIHKRLLVHQAKNLDGKFWFASEVRCA